MMVWVKDVGCRFERRTGLRERGGSCNQRGRCHLLRRASAAERASEEFVRRERGGGGWRERVQGRGGENPRLHAWSM